MKKKTLFFCLVLLIGMFAVTAGALASQKIKFDSTATMKLPDSFAYSETKNNIRYYKDTENKVTCGYRVSDGQVSLKDVKSTLKKAGYKSIKIKTVNDVEMCSGYKESGKTKTYMTYFNTKGSHFVMLAFSYNPGKAKRERIANNAIETIKVKEPEPDPAAPPFAWEGQNGDVTSTVYGGNDLILIYMYYVENGDNSYVDWYLATYKSYMSKLKKKDVQVLVCLSGYVGADERKALSKKYPSMVFGLQKDEYEEDLWTALERLGYKKREATFPVVILRSRSNRLRDYKTGSLDNAKTIVKKAVAMAEENTPAVPPDPDEIPEGLDGTFTAGVCKFKISGKNAVLVGTINKTMTELEIPKSVTYDDVVYPVTEIAAKACSGMTNLTNLQIDTNVSKIGKQAFKDCAKLQTIVFTTDKLTRDSVGANAFAGIADKPLIKCPKNVINDYKTWLIEKGVPENASFKAIQVK